jgi:transketolase
MTSRFDTQTCLNIRRRILQLANKSGEGHVPSSLSIVEMVVAVYQRIAQQSLSNDLFILSKGHAALGLFSALESMGKLDGFDLDSFCEIDSPFGGHPSSMNCSAVTFSTGSLGHGLPVAAGLAHFHRHSSQRLNIYTLLGDQECNEGSIWESALIASTLNLDNLVALVDVNRSDNRSMPMLDHESKWSSFGWNVLKVDGHSLEDLHRNLDEADAYSGRPSVLLCETVKGKGVSFMENSPEWHHKKISLEDLSIGLAELSIA